jgi:hypothetical protein
MSFIVRPEKLMQVQFLLIKLNIKLFQWSKTKQSIIERILPYLMKMKVPPIWTFEYWAIIRLLTGLSSFRCSTELTFHYIVLSYDPSHSRACSNTQSLAFRYFVSTRQWQSGADQWFAFWFVCPLFVGPSVWRSTLLFYSMTFPIPERIQIRSHWPSDILYPSGNDNQVPINDSSPDWIALFQSFHRTDVPLYCFILWPFPFQSVFQYAVIGLQIFCIHQVMTIRCRSMIRLLTCLPSFHRSIKLTTHSIVLFYDLSQHRAYSYTQSLAFGYSVSAQRWQAGSSDDQFATWHQCPLSVCLPNWRSTLLFYSMTFPNTERIPIRSHWPSDTPYPPGDDKQVPATINSPPAMSFLFSPVYRADHPCYCFNL